MDNKLLTNSIIAVSVFIAGNVYAYEAYNLHDDLWAVECKDGKLETYSGNELGLEKLGASLCKDNGGLLGESTELIVKAFNGQSNNSRHETSIIIRGLEDSDYEEIPSEIHEPSDAKEKSTEELYVEEK